jgi:hypothetical protein
VAKYVVPHCNSQQLTADNQSNVSTPLHATIEWVDSHNNGPLDTRVDNVPPDEHDAAYYAQPQGRICPGRTFLGRRLLARAERHCIPLSRGGLAR